MFFKKKGRNGTPFFFGLKVRSPWPSQWPEGRLLDEANRHYTLVFLGNCSAPQKNEIELPSFVLGPCGLFTKVLFLPKRHPHVVAWEVKWLEPFLRDHEGQICRRFGKETSSIPHVTIARSPKTFHLWKEAFQILPLYAESLHLYESLGYSQYQSVWEHPFIAPFEEIEHTADVAFCVRGENFHNLYVNAFIALCFHCPEVAPFWQDAEVNSVAEIVMALNRIVSVADTERGCPLKAVSFHGHARKREQFLEWEMIIDI